jgi:hypothetical protein
LVIELYATAATQTIHHEPAHPSHLLVPLVPLST